MRLGRLTSALLLLGGLAHAETVSVVTESLPPYSYDDEGTVRGLSTEVVLAVCAEAAVHCEIRLYPWARALATAQQRHNVLIYSIFRTPEREKQFRWVGEIAPRRAFLFRRKARTDIQVGSLEDAKRYAIGAVNGDARAEYLKSQGFTDLQLVPDDYINLRKLQAGRIDLLLTNEFVFNQIAVAEGLDPRDFEKAYYLTQYSQGDFSMAFGQNSDDALVERFRAALARIKASGQYERIVRAYRLE